MYAVITECVLHTPITPLIPSNKVLCIYIYIMKSHSSVFVILLSHILRYKYKALT